MCRFCLIISCKKRNEQYLLVSHSSNCSHYVFDFFPPTDVLSAHVCTSVARKHYIGHYLAIHIECAVGRRRITRRSRFAFGPFPSKSVRFFLYGVMSSIWALKAFSNNENSNRKNKKQRY